MQQIDHVAYPRKLKSLSNDSLLYIQKDAHEAMVANPEGEKAGYYADEINYCADELFRRKAQASFPAAKRNTHTYKGNKL